MTSDQTAHLNMMKQQQWTSTYYIMLMFAAMFAVKRAFEPLLAIEKWIGTIAALLVLGIGVLFLGIIQYDIGTFRQRLDEADDKAYVRGLEFTIPLGLTMLAGAITVTYWFWR